MFQQRVCRSGFGMRGKTCAKTALWMIVLGCVDELACCKLVRACRSSFWRYREPASFACANEARRLCVWECFFCEVFPLLHNLRGPRSCSLLCWYEVVRCQTGCPYLCTTAPQPSTRVCEANDVLVSFLVSGVANVRNFVPAVFHQSRTQMEKLLLHLRVEVGGNLVSILPSRHLSIDSAVGSQQAERLCWNEAYHVEGEHYKRSLRHKPSTREAS